VKIYFFVRKEKFTNEADKIYQNLNFACLSLWEKKADMSKKADKNPVRIFFCIYL
jgi:hypothetical protein